MGPEDETQGKKPLSTNDQDEITEMFRKNRGLRGESLEIIQKARKTIRKLNAQIPRPPLN